MDSQFHLEVRSIGRTTHGPGQLRDALEYILRAHALERAFGRHIPTERAHAASWASWYVDPNRRDSLRVNARVADSWNGALPNGLSAESHERIAEVFMALATGGRQDEMPWIVAVHRGREEGEAPDARNDHAHGLLMDRTVHKVGRRRTVIGMSDRPDAVYLLRQCWGQAIAGELTRLGRVGEKFDHRSLRAQRIDAIIRGDALQAVELDRRPTIHVGGAGTGKAKRGEKVRTNDRYADLDAGRSRADANAERLAERKVAKEKAAALALASEEERLRALVCQAEDALQQIAPLYGSRLERLGGVAARAGLVAVRDRTLRALGALTPSSPDTVPTIEPIPHQAISALVVLRPVAAPSLSRARPFVPMPLSRSAQPFSLSQAPVQMPWFHRQAVGVRIYVEEFEALMKSRAGEIAAAASKKIDTTIALIVKKRGR